MAALLPLEIVTPIRKLFDAEVSAAVLPAFDGERGILPGHQDFVGVLGTGPLKVIQNGNDYWFLVSSGVYTVTSGHLRVIAELGEAPGEIDLSQARSELTQLQQKLASLPIGKEKAELQQQSDLLKARIDVFRRTKELN